MERSDIPRAAGAWLVAGAALCLLAGCTSERLTEPAETATEQLLVSTAVDHAVARLRPPIAAGAKVFVDTQYFDMGAADAILPKYTLGAVRDLILHKGGRLVADRKSADLVVELRNGAQSIDHDSHLIGIPAIPIPIPLAGTLTTPELALYKHDKQIGVSKIALTVFSAKTGALVGSTGATYGASSDTEWTAMLFYTWETGDVTPKKITETDPRR